MPDWMVHVETGTPPLTGTDELDRLLDAVLEEQGTLAASLAGGENPSVLVTVAAATAHEAGRVGERIVAGALHVVGERSARVRAVQVLDGEGEPVAEG